MASHDQVEDHFLLVFNTDLFYKTSGFWALFPRQVGLFSSFGRILAQKTKFVVSTKFGSGNKQNVHQLVKKN